MTLPLPRATLPFMLPDKEITEAILKARQALNEARRTRDAALIRQEIDILTCLIDESPDTVHWKINGLIDQFEGLRKVAVH